MAAVNEEFSFDANDQLLEVKYFPNSISSVSIKTELERFAKVQHLLHLAAAALAG